MRKKTIILTLGLLSAASVWAQDDITKQLEVTKAYTPKVGRAAKLAIEPRMVDTVQLRPEIQYAIAPVAWQTVFKTDKYRPAQISVVPYEKNLPFYLRAGIGYPLQSTADLYFNPYIGNRSTFGMYFNHRGSYSKIENELGVKPKSTEMLHAVGLYGSKHFRRYKLEGSFGYDNRIYNAYGVHDPGYTIEGIDPANTRYSFSESGAFQLGQIRGHVTYGDTFTNLNRFNFLMGLNLGAAHMGASFYQFDVDAWLKFGRMYGGKHGFEIGLYERGAIGMGDLSDYGSAAVSLNPNYILALDKFLLRAGVDITYIDSTPDTKKRWLITPQVEATLDIAGGYFTPYLTISSELFDGSPQTLSRRNPYSGGGAPTGLTQDIRLGFSGKAGEVFSYRVSGGASWLNNYSVFAGWQTAYWYGDLTNGTIVYNPLLFSPITDDGMKYTVGAELDLNNLGGFSAKLYANWYGCDFKNLPVAAGLPGYDAGLELAYTHKKIAVKAGVDITGKRKFIDYTLSHASLVPDSVPYDPITTVGTGFDVSLGAEYNISKRFGVFVEGRNLANQKLYPYNHYRGLGANVMLGIKAVF